MRKRIASWSFTLALAALLPWLLPPAHGDAPAVGRVVEIRSYNLKPGTRDRFHQLFEREALPMLHRFKVDVVAYGPSRHDADSYFLMRSFASVDERQKSEDAFYGSDEWRKGPREAILAAIDSYTTVVVHLDEATIRGLRTIDRHAGDGKEDAVNTSLATSDLANLLTLNDDYIRSVLASDVTRFDEILADDFLCSMPDGSLLDRKQFLERTARPAGITSLEVHDVNVRVMGDTAIIHARTTYTTADGHSGAGRYTDVWARRKWTWLAVAAHVTRLV